MADSNCWDATRTLSRSPGKRASLAGLTRQLLAIPGVRDGIVFLPDATASRVAALVAAPGLSVA
jgi:hypothetical protein